MSIKMQFSWAEKFGPVLFQMTLSAILNGYEMIVLTDNNNIENANNNNNMQNILFSTKTVFT